MAEEIGELEDTIYRWRKRGRIPEEAWPKIIEKAAKHEKLVTAQQLMNLNGPVGRRGRPRQNAVAT
jgi:hypothetical protein